MWSKWLPVQIRSLTPLAPAISRGLCYAEAMQAKTNLPLLVRQLLSVPFIWAPLLPVLFADIIVELYHRVAFRLYGIPYVSRSKYIRIDRHKLPYLSLTEKINCVYCGYMNGWFRYASVIAGATELYWCDIRHEKRRGADQPPHHKRFHEFGDAEAFIAHHRNKRQ